jgi:hypothetical protein
MGLLRKIEYRDFLKTEFWLTLSAYKKNLVENKCESCGSKENLQCHHKFYQKSERKNPELILGMRVARRRPRHQCRP